MRIELTRVVSERPHLAEVMTVLLYETLGPTLGAGNENAASVWGVAHNFARRYPESLRRAGFSGEGAKLGDALFDAILKNRFGSRRQRRSVRGNLAQNSWRADQSYDPRVDART